MIIREVTKADNEAITDIYNPYIADTTITFETDKLSVETMSGRVRFFVENGYPFLVAEDDDVIIGYCYAHPWKEKAAYQSTWETTVYLRPGRDHAGVGSALMNELIARCRKSGAHALIACITGDNIGSMEFHRKLGFKEVSRFEQVGFKFGHWLDVVDMELILD